MSDLRAIVQAAAELREPALTATVMRVRGSSYRRPGARMLLTRERWLGGSVSGGCLEGDVLQKGWWRTEQGPALVTYDAAAQDDVRWGFGLGCDGVVNVLLERTPAPGRIDPLATLARCLETQERAALATVFVSQLPDVPVGARVVVRPSGAESDLPDGALRDQLVVDACVVLAKGESSSRSYPGVEVFIEALLPPPRLFIFGGGHDAVPVATLARTVGWEVIVCEPHARFVTRERFAAADQLLFAPPEQAAAHIDASDRAMAVVMGHNYEQDRAVLAMLLGSRARYIGMLGPRRRTARMLVELERSIEDDRLHAPVGLQLGAESPQEIALAIVAEVQSVLTRAQASNLRTLSAIHRTAPESEGAQAALG